jgi:hypothetical protein
MIARGDRSGDQRSSAAGMIARGDRSGDQRSSAAGEPPGGAA